MTRGGGGRGGGTTTGARGLVVRAGLPGAALGPVSPSDVGVGTAGLVEAGGLVGLGGLVELGGRTGRVVEVVVEVVVEGEEAGSRAGTTTTSPSSCRGTKRIPRHTTKPMRTTTTNAIASGMW